MELDARPVRAGNLLLSLMIEKYTKVEPQTDVSVSSRSELRMVVSPLKIRKLKDPLSLLRDKLASHLHAQIHLNITVETITRQKVSYVNIQPLYNECEPLYHLPWPPLTP